MTSLSYMFKEAFNNLGRNALVVLGAILAVFIGKPGVQILPFKSYMLYLARIRRTNNPVEF